MPASLAISPRSTGRIARKAILPKPRQTVSRRKSRVCEARCNSSKGWSARKTRRDRMQAKLQEIKTELRRRMHQTIPDQGHWLKQVVTGHFAYYAVPTNSR